MLGDVLRKRVQELSSTTKYGKNAFWIKLRDIAREEIITIAPQKVDSDIIVPLYYKILSENEKYIPVEFRKFLPSNNQEAYRVKNRNLFTSNAFHPDGLANQDGIKAVKELNSNRKGYRIIYQGLKGNDNKER